MNNADFDYSYIYRIWHQDTPESRKDEIAAWHTAFTRHRLFPSSANAKVLEIGCGMGRLLAMLREQGYSDLIGIDIDASQIDVASREEGIRVHLADAVEFVKRVEGQFDVIYCFDVLEHIDKEKQLTFLRTLSKSLADNGFLVLRIPNALAPIALCYRYEDFTHTVSYTENTVRFLLHNAGTHFMSVRPQHQESLELQRLKLPWAKLYRLELNENPILTLNLMAIAFKNEDAFKKWQASVPMIRNDYPDGCWQRIKNSVRRWNRRIFKPIEQFIKIALASFAGKK
jgi:2-polyprenyl-3-methyl-5-hydroxy-6-metoxy-1,4-benzoquinol methylase